MKTQVIFIEQVPHIKVMCNSLIGYPECKMGFPWLVYIRENSKEVALVLFKEIMENFNNSFGSDTNFMLRDGQGQKDKKESYTEEWL